MKILKATMAFCLLAFAVTLCITGCAAPRNEPDIRYIAGQRKAGEFQFLKLRQVEPIAWGEEHISEKGTGEYNGD